MSLICFSTFCVDEISVSLGFIDGMNGGCINIVKRSGMTLD